MNIFRRIIGTHEPVVPAEEAAADPAGTADADPPPIREHISFAYNKIGNEPEDPAADELGTLPDVDPDKGHEGEIALVSTTWQGGPSVGANETLTVGTSRTENTGGTEHQDDWSSQGAAADPDQPLVIGTLHNPDAAEATSELAESAGPPAEAPTASPRLMEAVAQGEHVAPAEADPSEALAAGEGPVEPEPAVDVFLRPKGIPGESKDVPPPDEGSDELSAPVPDDDAGVPYLRYELKNTMVSSYNLDDDDGGPSTLVDLGDTGAIEDTAQYAEPDLESLAEQAEALPDMDDIEEPEL